MTSSNPIVCSSTIHRKLTGLAAFCVLCLAAASAIDVEALGNGIDDLEVGETHNQYHAYATTTAAPSYSSTTTASSYQTTETSSATYSKRDQTYAPKQTYAAPSYGHSTGQSYAAPPAYHGGSSYNQSYGAGSGYNMYTSYSPWRGQPGSYSKESYGGARYVSGHRYSAHSVYDSYLSSGPYEMYNKHCTRSYGHTPKIRYVRGTIG